MQKPQKIPLSPLKRGPQRGALALRVLELIGNAATTTGDIIETILTSPYGSSYRQLDRRMEEIRSRREKHALELEKERRYYDLLHRLHRDGLIEKKKNQKKRVWFTTLKGREEVKRLKKYNSHRIPKSSYPKTSDEELKLVMFDIPEECRRKRNWLRGALKYLGFTMLQKSVWVGKIKLPEEFMDDIQLMKLTQYIEIVAITKSGSLKKLAPSSLR